MNPRAPSVIQARGLFQGSAMFRRLSLILTGVMLLTLAACGTTTNLSKATTFVPPPGPFKVAIMKPDVQVSLLTAGGLEEPNADWTQKARENLLGALKSQLSAQGGNLVTPENFAANTEMQVVDFERLHRVVGSTILTHRFIGAFDLPTKKDKFDWTLGAEASAIKAATGADYALFLFARDSFSSGGRKATMLMMAALGVGIPGGSQVGFVSLVDLKSGNVVWFNVLATQTGDLREAGGAQSSVASMIKGMPVTPASLLKK